MTDLKDGFGHSVSEQVAAGGYTVTLYGGAPDPGPWIHEPWPQSIPGTGTAPPIPPIVVTPAPRPEGFMLSVTGQSGVVFSIALSAEEWAAVKGAILREVAK